MDRASSSAILADAKLHSAGTGSGTNAGTIKVGAGAVFDIDGTFANAATGQITMAIIASL